MGGLSLGDVDLAFEILGSGPPMVWCHGLASCVDGDRDVIDAFARQFTVLAYDARGHGRSSPVLDSSRFSYPLLASDLVALLDHVGWERAVLAGASMGAATCARVACMHPARATALVMARPGAIGPDGAAPVWLRMLFAGGAHAIRSSGIDGAIAFLMSLPEARGELEGNPARIEALRRDWMRHDPLSIAAALEGVPRTSALDGGLRADMVQCPSLVIPGNDLIHPTDAGIAVASLIPGAAAAPPFDSLPRDQEVAGLVALVRDFLSEKGVI